MAKKYKARPINGGKKDFVSRDTHAVTLFSFFFFPPLSLVPPLSLSLSLVPFLPLSLSLSFSRLERIVLSMNYRWRSRASYARSEAIRYRVRACVHNIRSNVASLAGKPANRATYGRGEGREDRPCSIAGAEG